MSTIPIGFEEIEVTEEDFCEVLAERYAQFSNLQQHIANRDTVAWTQKWVIPYRTDVHGNRYPECGVLGCGLIEPHWHGCVP